MTVADAPVSAPDALLAVKPGDVPAAAAAVADAGAERALSVAAGVTTRAIEEAAAAAARGPRDAEHAGADRRGRLGDRARRRRGGGRPRVGGGRARRGRRRRPRARVPARRGHRALRLRPGLRVPGRRGAGRGGRAQRPPRDTAETLAFQTLAGAARLLAEGDASPADLRAAVTSPGGTTAAGLAELERHGARAAFLDAVTAATRRSRELGALTVS